MTSSLWAWAVAAWARPGVERACLDLQDIDGQSVALLLWRAWRAAEGAPANLTLCERAAALARPIETDVLGPLRAVRHALAGGRTATDENLMDAARATVRAAELSLERLLLETLEQLPVVTTSDSGTDAASALVSMMTIWSGSASDEEARARAMALARALG